VKNLTDFYSLENLPDALFVFCAKRHRNAIKEAQKMNIPVIGILGLEDNPDGLKYFIPLNDNTKRGIEFIFSKIEELYKKVQSNQLTNNQNNQEKIKIIKKMYQPTIEQIKKLREMTLAPIMSCKEALIEAQGNLDEAQKF